MANRIFKIKAVCILLTCMLFINSVKDINAQSSFFAGGSGTEEDPYQISTCEQLQNMREDTSAYYRLINDIDCSETQNWNDGEGFVPLDSFTGGIDGQNHVVSNLFIHPDTGNAALIDSSSGDEIKDLILKDVDIKSKDGNASGLITGRINSRVSNVHITGRIEASEHAFGLSGAIRDVMADCSFKGEIIAGGDAGGIARLGPHFINSLIRCKSSGEITGHGNVGGLAAIQRTRTTRDVYSDAVIRGTGNLGGIIGRVSDEGSSMPYRAYFAGKIIPDDEESNIGGLIGYSEPEEVDYVTDSFYDSSKLSADAVGNRPEVLSHAGKTSAELKYIDTYTNHFENEDIESDWSISVIEEFDPDDPTVWFIEEEVDYPRFRFEYDPPRYSLNIEIVGNGSVEIDPEQEDYLAWEEVSLTALPDEGHHFQSWSGDIGERDPVLEEIVFERMEKERNITVEFGLGSDPAVTVVGTSDIFYKGASANLRGYLEEMGDLSEVDLYFQYRKKGEDSWREVEAKTGVENTGLFEYRLTNLDQEAVYEYRAKAEGIFSDNQLTHISEVSSFSLVPQTSMELSRTEGTAPLAVFGDATGTSSSLTDEEFHELYYEWDFGNPEASFVNRPDVNPNNPKGAVVAHVYENPGVYTVTLTITDPNGIRTVKEQQVTVKDPDEVFADSTYYLSAEGNFTDCPTQNPDYRYTDIEEAFSELFDGSEGARRLLIRRGEEYLMPSSTIVLQGDGFNPLQVGTYGSGDKPLLRRDHCEPTGDNVVHGVTMFVVRDMGEFSFAGLELYGGYDASTGEGNRPRGIEVQSDNTLFLRNTMSGLRMNFLSRGPKYFFAVDNHISNWSYYGHFGSLNKSVYLGNSIKQAENVWRAPGGRTYRNDMSVERVSPAHGPIRIGTPRKVVISYNDMYNNAGWSSAAKAVQPNIRLAVDSYGLYTIVSENLLEGGFSVVSLATSRQRDSFRADERIIFERNRITAGTSGASGLVGTGRPGRIIRNNIFYKPNQGSEFHPWHSPTYAISVGNPELIEELEHIREVPLWIYNNTFIDLNEEAGRTATMLHMRSGSSEILQDIRFYNNIHYAPYAEAPRGRRAGIVHWYNNPEEPNAPGGILSSDHNMLYAPDIEHFVSEYLTQYTLYPLEQWQSEYGLDLNSIDGYPLFVDTGDTSPIPFEGVPSDLDLGTEDNLVHTVPAPEPTFDLNLQPESPAVTGGTAVPGLYEDFRGRRRIHGKSPDIGALELGGLTVINPPGEVENLEAETKSEKDGEVLLTWVAPGLNRNKENNTGGYYEVRYATYSVGEKPLEWWYSISTNTVSYYSGKERLENPQNAGETEERIVDGLFPGTTFFFGVRVYNANEEQSDIDINLSMGNPASAVSGDADPGPPSRLRIKYIGMEAHLLWDESSSSVLKKYGIHRSTKSGYYTKSKTTATVPGTKTKYDISLNDEESYFDEHDKYYFTVTAVNIVDSTSTYSNEVKLTPDVTPPVIEDLTARTRVLGRKKIKVSVTDDRQVYEVGGGYRSLGSDSEHYPELEFVEEPEEGSPNYEGMAEIDDFYISSEGFEYYITASDAFNTSTTTWVQVRSSKDLPEQGFITPNNPELIFGSEVEEVLISDVRGNEVFKDKRGSSNYIVWNPSRNGIISLESGLYIYRIKTEEGYKYGSVVVAK